MVVTVGAMSTLLRPVQPSKALLAMLVMLPSGMTTSAKRVASLKAPSPMAATFAPLSSVGTVRVAEVPS